MQWTKAAARIDTLIRRGQYLTKDAMADFGRQEAAEGALPKETAPDANEEIGRSKAKKQTHLFLPKKAPHLLMPLKIQLHQKLPPMRSAIRSIWTTRSL